jgi:hypothetical protein
MLTLTELVGLYGTTNPQKKCDLKPSVVIFVRQYWPFITNKRNKPQWDEKENETRCKNDNCKVKCVFHKVHLGWTGFKRPLRHSIQIIQKARKIPSKGPFLDILYER